MSENVVGKAYLTLVPKLETNDTSKLSTQVGEAGTVGGDKFSSGFTSKIKSLPKVAAIATAASAVADVFMQSFNEAARNEQLVGGVEKIFEGMNVSTVFADAKRAYSELNLSANDYLELINDVGASFKATMGDEKGYETARQGLMAISDYASGTGKNMNELMGKFSAITRATSSYQSIADQFSGILPATSQAFLEQAQEVGLLSESYKKLTDVPIDEYQAAVAAMLEEGVTGLGLYQNTAKETDTTVSGSLAAMKASWTNFVTAIGTGDDIQGAAANLVESFITALSNIIPLAVQVIMGMAEGVLAAFGNLLDKGINFINGMVGDFVEAAGNLVEGMVKGIFSGVTAVVNAIKSVCRNALDAVKSFFGIHSPSRVMQQMGGYIGEGLAIGIEDSKGMVEDAMGGVMDATYMKAAGVKFGMAGATVNNYNIAGIDMTGESDIEGAVLTVMGGLRRRGALYA